MPSQTSQEEERGLHYTIIAQPLCHVLEFGLAYKEDFAGRSTLYCVIKGFIIKEIWTHILPRADITKSIFFKMYRKQKSTINMKCYYPHSVWLVWNIWVGYLIAKTKINSFLDHKSCLTFSGSIHWLHNGALKHFQVAFIGCTMELSSIFR